MSPDSVASSMGCSTHTPVYTNAYLQKRERSIREVVGFMSEEFSCSHNHYRGALFVGSDGVLFEGFLFFFQQKVVALKWRNVVRIDKSDHSITIIAKNQDEEAYEFKSAQNTERLWSTLMSLYHETLTGTPRSRSNSLQARVPLRRNLSDPLPELPDKTAEEGEITDQDYAAACAVATMTNRDTSSIFRLSKSLPPSRSNSPTPEESDSAVTEQRNLDSTALQEEWDRVVANSKTSFSVCVMKNVELDCDLDTFVEKFLSDGATNSIPSYMQRLGDKDMVVSSWKPFKDGVSNTRAIEYSHPVNAPLAPPMARAKKDQRYRRYGDHGLAVTTETHVQDVPMTDCFFVIDQILVEQRAEGLSLTTVFDIRFVKSTMFRSIIANTTRNEFQSWFEGLGNLMCTTLGGAPATALSEKNAPGLASPSPPPSSMERLLLFVVLALMVLILLLQVYIILEIKILKLSHLTLANEVCT